MPDSHLGSKNSATSSRTSKPPFVVPKADLDVNGIDLKAVSPGLPSYARV
jgi:hypothetical protein